MRLKGFATPKDCIWAGSITHGQYRATHTPFERAGQDQAPLIDTVKCPMIGRGIPAPSAMGIAALDPPYAATPQFAFVGWVEHSDTHHFGTNPVRVNSLWDLPN